jgi:diguanylate cyclase (GGDEF)-like protein/PAS domain S-box-containing protein
LTAPEHSRTPSLFEALQLHTRTAVLLAEGRVDEGLTIRRANAAFAAMVDLPLDELVDHPLNRFTGALTGRDAVDTIRTALSEQQSVSAELAIYRADGRPLWIEADIAPLPGGEHVVIVARDITERRAAERELARTGELLRIATAAGRVGIWEWEPGADRVAWNATLRELIGVSADEPATLERWLDVTHPEDRAVARRAADSEFADGEARYRIVRPSDGGVIHVVVRAERTDESERPRLVGAVVDVTAVQEAADRVQETLESITDAYYALDTEYCFTNVNRHAERLLSKPRNELLDACLWDTFPEIAATEFATRFRVAMDERRPVAFEAFYEPLDGWFEVRAYPVPDGIAVYFRDIDARRATEAALQHQAAHDALTNLANRTQLLEHLRAALGGGAPVSLLFVDLDRFKHVNDSLGHAAGDAMLRAVAGRLTGLVRRGDVVARLGGDEFVVGLIDATPAAANAIAERILQAVRAPVEVGGQAVVTTASIGISRAGGHGEPEALLHDADVALYRAKDAGRDQAVWFDDRARHELHERVRTEHDLRTALPEGQLDVHYQPAFDLRTGRTTGVEALLRWTHPERGPIAPGDFIAIAEESGLILPIGDWVLATAARQAAAWTADDDPFTAWANVSARQLARPGLAGVISRHLDSTGLAPGRLGVEITESVLADSAAVRRELAQIGELGVHVAIDDFGAGFSSIGRLRELPVDVLKIDRSFIAAMADPGGVETVAAVVDLGHAFGRTVLAEGVETHEQLAALRETGCDAVAGFLLAEPVAAAEVRAAVARGAATLAAG